MVKWISDIATVAVYQAFDNIKAYYTCHGLTYCISFSLSVTLLVTIYQAFDNIKAYYACHGLTILFPLTYQLLQEFSCM